MRPTSVGVAETAVLNPTADRAGEAARDLATRSGSLRGRTVGLLWNGKANGDQALRVVQRELGELVPQATFKFYSGTIRCDPSLLATVAEECDVVVGCTADCGSCTSWMAHDCAQLERLGVPAVAIVSQGFDANYRASARAFGAPSLNFTVVPHVYNNADAETVRAQTVAAVPMLVRLLTGSNDSDDLDGHGSAHERILPVRTDDASDISEAVSTRFTELGWTDGYPVVAPTPRRVDELIQQCPHERDDVLFRLPPGNGVLTAEKLAVNCAMAGCTPDEMSVVEAVLSAFTDEEQRTMVRVCLMSTSAHAPLVVLNGPLAARIGVNGGRGCVGPGAQNAVNLRISRAISLCLNNIGQWSPGVMDLDTLGTPRKNIVVVAENELESPWSAFHVDHGYLPDEDTVTVFFSMGEWDIGVQGDLGAEQLAKALGSFGGINSGTGYFTSLFTDHEQSPMGRLMLMSPMHAHALTDGGIDKTRTREVLFETGREQLSSLAEPVRKLHQDGKIRDEWKWVFTVEPAEADVTFLSVIESVTDYHIVVAGSGRGKNLLMPIRCRPIIRRIAWSRTDTPGQVSDQDGVPAERR